MESEGWLMHDDLMQAQQMDTEWRAWGAVVVRLRECGVDLNRARLACAAIERWGEELAELRRSQPAETAARALDDKRLAHPDIADVTPHGEAWALPQ